MNYNIRVDDLWFSNDTLVLKADEKVFRVSKSLLAMRSSVFRDMVAFPSPTIEDAEIIEGSPVVLLHDSADSVEVFLRAIFDSSYFMPPPARVELHSVLSILRLSHKYDVQYLFLRALQHLSVRYGPSSLDNYRGREDSDHIIYAEDGARCYLAIISALREVEALWLLPVAYYTASTCTEEALRSTIAHGAAENVVQTCLVAQSHIMRGSGAMYRFLARPSAECANRKGCAELRLRSLDLYFDFLHGRDLLCPLDYWSDSDWEDLSSVGWCERCVSHGQEIHRAELQDFWDSLPSIYALPPWAELNAMKDAVMDGTQVGLP
ncbi:hypothetical protein B0H17DRAFT_1197509 [Mycena rosella]|uniref:BTB domain-containing protein n=1 Tax=Mycena rosella TaxID=1033263 RepID=A0AAD7DRN5_MYCRO|nr:hypothetical protein B0H17DRAFT_1197509 [Mycena rosella]